MWIFFSTVNTTILQDLRLVESEHVEEPWIRMVDCKAVLRFSTG